MPPPALSPEQSGQKERCQQVGKMRGANKWAGREAERDWLEGMMRGVSRWAK